MPTAWGNWNYDWGTSTGWTTNATTTTNSIVWTNWINNTATTGAYDMTTTTTCANDWIMPQPYGLNDTIWQQWYNTPNQVQYAPYTPPQLTPEQQAERDEAMRQRYEDMRIADEAREAAEKTARELLLAVLDAKQKRDLLAHGWFEVISDKGRRWRIRDAGPSGNVDLMPEDSEVRLASYCAHPGDQLPKSDHYVAQKLALETDEESFVKVANVHYLSERGRRVAPTRTNLDPAAEAVA